MDQDEAIGVLRDHLRGYRARTYAELVTLIGDADATELAGKSGATYQIEVEVFWDAERGGDVRVLGSIDDGSFWRAFKPLCADFLVAPDGRFVGE